VRPAILGISYSGWCAMYLYVTGGRQRRIREVEDEWVLYDRALILRLDSDTGTSEVAVTYETPPEARPEGASSVLFKHATLRGSHLYVCTSTEVLIYQVPAFRQIGYVSLPCFNDLHHVSVTEQGRLLVVSTGLDAVFEVTVEGHVTREWSVLGEDPWQRFSRAIDYRKVVTTKPHLSHPNFVFTLGEEVWSTRFEQRDAVCLTAPGQRIDLGGEKPHDGVSFGEHLYFTSVDGHLVAVDARTLRIDKVIDLNALHAGRSSLLGWCRGIFVVDARRVWVGFTRVRKTRFRENLNWIKHAFRETEMPTHIACYDLAAGRCLQEIPLEAAGLNIVFSTLPALSENG
jgi:PQQ-like domain